MKYCVDDRHGTPCPDCAACQDECDPAAVVTADNAVDAMRAAGWSEEYIAEQISKGRLSYE